MNQNVKKTRTFFSKSEDKEIRISKEKALLRLNAIKQHEEDMEHALYKDLGNYLSPTEIGTW